MLTADEIATLWTLGVPLDALFLPEDEILRAIPEQRVQIAESSSCMGTAETGWRRASSSPDELRWIREDGVVVAPGRLAEQSDDFLDDRDVVGRLWEPFWSDQLATLARSLPPSTHDTMLEECARMLVELERKWPHDSKHRAMLLDWLVAADRLDRDTLTTELRAITTSANRHLALGVDARWLSRDLRKAFDAVMRSAVRFKSKAFRAEQHAARLALFRFAANVAAPALPYKVGGLVEVLSEITTTPTPQDPQPETVSRGARYRLAARIEHGWDLQRVAGEGPLRLRIIESELPRYVADTSPTRT